MIAKCQRLFIGIYGYRYGVTITEDKQQIKLK